MDGEGWIEEETSGAGIVWALHFCQLTSVVLSVTQECVLGGIFALPPW